MKVGVLAFGNDKYEGHAEMLKQAGYYSANLGDNAQSIAIRNIFRQIGIADEDIVSINRDTIPAYDGEETVLIMNALMEPWCFPIPANIKPIFIGFCAEEDVIKKHAAFFKSHEPIGCRDLATTEHMMSHGIRAFTTGCLTLTFPPRSSTPPEPKLLIVYGSNLGAFPSRVLKYIPAHLADTAEFISHRLHVNSQPLSLQQCLEVDKFEKSILRQYQERATLVLTPLHHVCTPCLAMGIPVIVCRDQFDPRFSFLQNLLPIYTPDRFSQIDWEPKPIDVNKIRTNLITMVRDGVLEAVQRAGQPASLWALPWETTKRKLW